MIVDALHRWFDKTITDLLRQMRWSYLPPLMVYFAAGISGLTAIVGAFFIKEYLGLSAVFLAGLAFWVRLPWAIKMPLGHLVDLIWRWKTLLVYLGSSLIALSISIMYGLIAHTSTMNQIMSVEGWYVLSALLAPVGYVMQDVVADAMTVEAVPIADAAGIPFSESEIKGMHTTMQTLGRFSIISGFLVVAAVNIFMFSGVEVMTDLDKADIYARLYLMALVIPVISISGVILNDIIRRRQSAKFRQQGLDEAEIEKLFYQPPEDTKPNWWIFGGSLAFVIFTLTMGLGNFPLAQEIVFAGSMAIVIFLISRLVQVLDPAQARSLVGTAIIIFIFRATPLPGAGAIWFEIDELGFDQQFISVLSFVSSCLALVGMILLRPLMATRSIAYIVALLTIAAGVLSLPNIGLYYGLHEWTTSWTSGIVDARFIAIIDTMIESPFGQIAMIPMLAWIAKNAPANLKATFFAVMASFTNLALSASSLGTKYLNQIFVVTREVKDRSTDAVMVSANYGDLGWLLITAALIGLLMPLAAILLVQNSSLRTQE